PAKTMSQAITTLTATAARNGELMANIPKMINKTPQTIDQFEACRTMPAGVCGAIVGLLKRRPKPTPKEPLGEGQDCLSHPETGNLPVEFSPDCRSLLLRFGRLRDTAWPRTTTSGQAAKESAIK